MANLRISDIGGGRFVVEKRGEEIDVAKSADGLVTLAKSGSFSSWQIVAAMQELAKLVGKPGESGAQQFDRAYAKGEMSRIPRSAELMTALRELGALEKMHKAGPFGARSALTESPPRSASATPPESRGFRFTAETMTGPPKVSPRRTNDTPRVLGPDDDGHLPSFEEIAMQIARANPAAFIGRDGKPNSAAIDRAMSERAGQDALERDRQRSLSLNAPP